MRIAVTHMTRMRNGHVCVAGVDVDTLRHVRPVLPSAQLGPRELATRGGPFDLATVVELGAATSAPVPPAVEDHRYHQWEAAALVPIPPAAYWDLLSRLARPKLRAIFGTGLRPHGPGGASVEQGAGSASLGCFLPRVRPRLKLVPRPDGSAALRMWLSDGELNAGVPVTDLRLFGEDRETPDQETVERVAARLASGERALLSVGLTRAFAKPGEPPAHWLQVNNIHLESIPCWRLADTVASGRTSHTAPALTLAAAANGR